MSPVDPMAFGKCNSVAPASDERWKIESVVRASHINDSLVLTALAGGVIRLTLAPPNSESRGCS
jgi:hypothetical protein